MSLISVLLSGRINSFTPTETAENGNLYGGMVVGFGEDREQIHVNLFGDQIAEAVQLGVGTPLAVSGILGELRVKDDVTEQWSGYHLIRNATFAAVEFGSNLNQVALTGEVSRVFEAREFKGATTQDFSLKFTDRGFWRQVIVETIGSAQVDEGEQVGVLGRLKVISWKDKSTGEQKSQTKVAASVVRRAVAPPELAAAGFAASSPSDEALPF